MKKSHGVIYNGLSVKDVTVKCVGGVHHYTVEYKDGSVAGEVSASGDVRHTLESILKYLNKAAPE